MIRYISDIDLIYYFKAYFGQNEYSEELILTPYIFPILDMKLHSMPNTDIVEPKVNYICYSKQLEG